MKKTIRTLYSYSKFERQKMVDVGGKHEIKKKKIIVIKHQKCLFFFVVIKKKTC